MATINDIYNQSADAYNKYVNSPKIGSLTNKLDRMNQQLEKSIMTIRKSIFTNPNVKWREKYYNITLLEMIFETNKKTIEYIENHPNEKLQSSFDDFRTFNLKLEPFDVFQTQVKKQLFSENETIDTTKTIEITPQVKIIANTNDPTILDLVNQFVKTPHDMYHVIAKTAKNNSHSGKIFVENTQKHKFEIPEKYLESSEKIDRFISNVIYPDVVLFYLDNCSYCHQFEPIVKKVMKHNNYIKVDGNHPPPQYDHLSIDSFPTMLIGGKLIVGSMTESELRSKLKEHHLTIHSS